MKVFQPFAGEKIGPFTVLSPSKGIYELLVPQFDRTPDPDQAALEAAGLWIGKSPGLFAKLADMTVAKLEKWVQESWDNERLKDGGKTSPTNESSVVLYGDFGPLQRVLLTGDAGCWALLLSAYQAGKSGLPMQFSFVQIPHHGSRSNVGPTILNQILGPILQKGSGHKFFAYVSAPKDDEAHPRKMVLNAFIRRGGSVVATQGLAKCYTIGYPFKAGYGVTCMPFSEQVRIMTESAYSGLIGGLKMITDGYERKARVYPALLLLMPVAIVVGCGLGSNMSRVQAVLQVVNSCGGLLLLAQLARDAGKKERAHAVRQMGRRPVSLHLSPCRRKDGRNYKGPLPQEDGGSSARNQSPFCR